MKAYREITTPAQAHPRDVAVVGAGNVAMDAARCAKRLGADVTVVYRRGEEEIPARKEEYEHAKEEGINFHLLCNPVEILADDKGWVRGLKCIRMELGEPDEKGRRRPIEVPGSEFEMACDSVIARSFPDFQGGWQPHLVFVGRSSAWRTSADEKSPRDRLSRVGKEHVCPAAAGQDRVAALSSRSSLAQAGQNDRFRSGIRRGARRNTPKRPLDHRRQLQPDAGTATGGMRHGIFFSICRLRTALRAWKRASVRSAKICRGSRRSSTRNSASLSRIFPRPGFPTSMRCWKSAGIKRSPYFIPAPSARPMRFRRRKPDGLPMEDRYDRNKPNRPFRPAVRGA